MCCRGGACPSRVYHMILQQYEFVAAGGDKHLPYEEWMIAPNLAIDKPGAQVYTVFPIKYAIL